MPDDYLTIDFTKKVIDLSNQNITEFEMDAVAPSVQALIMTENLLANLYCIPFFPNLRILHLDSCDLTDGQLRPLGDLQFLTCLIARNNRLSTLQQFSASLKVIDLSVNRLTKISPSAQPQNLTKVCFTSASSSDVVLKMFCRALQPGNTLNDLQIEPVVVNGNLQLEVRRLADVDVVQPVTLRCLYVLGGFEVREIYTREVRPQELMRFQMPLSKFQGEAYGYPTDAPEPQAFRMKLCTLRDEQESSGNAAVLLVAQNGRELVFPIDLTTKKVISLAQFDRLFTPAVPSSSAVPQGRAKLVDFDPNGQFCFNASQIQVNQQVRLLNCPPNHVVFYYQTELTQVELENETQNVLRAHNDSKFGALQEAVDRFNASNQTIVQKGDEEFLNFQLQSSRHLIPIFVKLQKLEVCCYNENFQVPVTASERYLVAQAACNGLQRVLVSQPVIANSKVDAVEIKIAANVLQIQPKLKTRRVFSQFHSFKVLKNEAVQGEQFNNYAVLSRKMAGLLTVRMQPRTHFGVFDGPEIESNAVYVRTGDADQSTKRLQGTNFKLTAGGAGPTQ